MTSPDGQGACNRLQGPGALPDLILLGLMMPVMNGWQFRGEQLKDTKLAKFPVIVLSGAGDVRKEAIALGVAGYVTKPFKLDALLGVVHRGLAGGAPVDPGGLR